MNEKEWSQLEGVCWVCVCGIQRMVRPHCYTRWTVFSYRKVTRSNGSERSRCSAPGCMNMDNDLFLLRRRQQK